MALPFFISLIGVLADYVTTTVGLNLGFYETHPQYHPAWALLIFWGCLTVLTLTFPKRRFWEMTKNAIASASFLGSVNNTLVIFKIFSGLKA
ncbi:MAG: hypothetical protein V1915_05165 [Candidatus Bathyarchaeota archaeon]